MAIKVIFLDAVGTLFGVKGSVGQMYAQVATGLGIELQPATIDRAFGQAFRQSSPMAFPGCAPQSLPDQEYAWWLQLAAETFRISGDREKFDNFEIFFGQLYNFFATGEPWIVYPDVIPALTTWQAQGLRLGIISNFDSRLLPVLEALELRSYFDTVTFSTQVGAAKPDPQIFYHALSLYNLAPADALHIGDSYHADYQGAIGAGLEARWLPRNQQTRDKSTSFESLQSILDSLPNP